MSTANIIRLVQTVLVAAVAAFALSVVVAGPRAALVRRISRVTQLESADG